MNKAPKRPIPWDYKLDDWKIFFKNPNTGLQDVLNMSSRYTKQKAKDEFYSVFPGVRIREIKRIDSFKAEKELKSRQLAASRVKKA